MGDERPRHRPARRLRVLARELGVACLVVMHDLNLAARYCDRLYVMSEGRAVAHGRPQDVLIPDLIREVYRVEATVALQPETGCPQILFLGAAELKKN